MALVDITAMLLVTAERQINSTQIKHLSSFLISNKIKSYVETMWGVFILWVF